MLLLLLRVVVIDAMIVVFLGVASAVVLIDAGCSLLLKVMIWNLLCHGSDDS